MESTERVLRSFCTRFIADFSSSPISIAFRALNRDSRLPGLGLAGTGLGVLGVHLPDSMLSLTTCERRGSPHERNVRTTRMKYTRPSTKTNDMMMRGASASWSAFERDTVSTSDVPSGRLKSCSEEGDENGWSQTKSRMDTQKNIIDHDIHTAGIARRIHTFQKMDVACCASCIYMSITVQTRIKVTDALPPTWKLCTCSSSSRNAEYRCSHTPNS